MPRKRIFSKKKKLHFIRVTILGKNVNCIISQDNSIRKINFMNKTAFSTVREARRNVEGRLQEILHNSYNSYNVNFNNNIYFLECFLHGYRGYYLLKKI